MIDQDARNKTPISVVKRVALWAALFFSSLTIVAGVWFGAYVFGKGPIDHVRACVGEEAWRRFTFQEGDIRELEACRNAVSGVDYVLHQAALGSVPRSLKDPLASNEVNVNGFLNMLVAARDEGVKSFTYAASSSTYGDSEALPKVEERIGQPLSPYAVTKYVNELYADVFQRSYGMCTTGLRYFNVFGPRQDRSWTRWWLMSRRVWPLPPPCRKPSPNKRQQRTRQAPASSSRAPTSNNRPPNTCRTRCGGVLCTAQAPSGAAATPATAIPASAGKCT